MLEKLIELNNEEYEKLIEVVAYHLNVATENNYTVDYWFNYDIVPEHVIISACEGYNIDLNEIVESL